MWRLELRCVKLIVLLLYAAHVGCQESQAQNHGAAVGTFLYDSDKVDALFDKINAIYERLLKIEAKQELQQIDSSVKFSQIIEKVGALEHLGSELSNKLSAYQQHQGERNTEIIEKLNESNEQLNATKIDSKTTLSELRVLSDQVSVQMKELKGFCQTESGLKEIYAAENSKSLNTLHELETNVNQLMDFEKKQSKVLENLKNSMITVNSLNLSDKHSQIVMTYASCSEAVNNTGHSGVYTIKSANPKASTVKVFCLESPAKSAKVYTLIMRRQMNSTHFLDFKRNWEDYKNGFGDPENDHWLGLEHIFSLLKSTRHELWIKGVSENGRTISSYYDDFRIGSEANEFSIMSLGNNTGNSDMKNCSKVPFNTFDRGNITYADSKGSTGFWGPCDVSFTAQEYKNDKLRILLTSGGIYTTYIHFGIRPLNVK